MSTITNEREQHGELKKWLTRLVLVLAVARIITKLVRKERVTAKDVLSSVATLASLRRFA